MRWYTVHIGLVGDLRAVRSSRGILYELREAGFFSKFKGSRSMARCKREFRTGSNIPTRTAGILTANSHDDGLKCMEKDGHGMHQNRDYDIGARSASTGSTGSLIIIKLIFGA